MVEVRRSRFEAWLVSTIQIKGFKKGSNMTVATKISHRRNGAIGKTKHFLVKPTRYEKLDQAVIAGLTGDKIDFLSRDEMVRVILAAKVPTLSYFDSDTRLRLYDCETLKRLVYKARQCCQNLLAY